MSWQILQIMCILTSSGCTNIKLENQSLRQTPLPVYQAASFNCVDENNALMRISGAYPHHVQAPCVLTP